MLHRDAFVLVLGLVAGCSAQVTPAPAPAPASSVVGTVPPPEDAGTKEPGPPKDASTDTGTISGTVDLPIRAAEYSRTQAGATTSAFSVGFELDNESAGNVTSIEEMTFDFGGGQKVALNQPACGGTFPIAAGTTKKVEARMVVSASGQVAPAGFSMQCPTSQSFGAGDGTAPTDAAFNGSIAIHVTGHTNEGTFAATGVAVRSQ